MSGHQARNYIVKRNLVSVGIPSILLILQSQPYFARIHPLCGLTHKNFIKVRTENFRAKTAKICCMVAINIRLNEGLKSVYLRV